MDINFYLLLLILILILITYYIKEPFTKCSADESRMSAYNSYLSLSKSPCTTSDLVGVGEDDIISEANQSGIKCPHGQLPISPYKSYHTLLKSQCK